ncbi:MAG: membrane protein insertion efficiency factor YidD [Planctomycetaceae bacterium]|nr:membrane protein insertion efficiency factor YidD [Planctomycetaceae bacterium]
MKPAKNNLAVRAAIFMIRCYKASISRYLGGQCRFVPSCSDYAIESFERFGFIKGVYKSLGRILRCNPFGGKGFDPVILEKDNGTNHPDTL